MMMKKMTELKRNNHQNVNKPDFICFQTSFFIIIKFLCQNCVIREKGEKYINNLSLFFFLSYQKLINLKMSFKKLQSNSPLLIHLTNYPVYNKLEGFLLSFSLISSFLETVSIYTLKFKSFLKEKYPSVSKKGFEVEKFIVDDILIKYVDVYFYFIKEDYKISDIKLITLIKKVPGYSKVYKLTSDLFSIINLNLISLGQLIDLNVGKDYKFDETLSVEVYSTFKILDSILNSSIKLISSYFTKSSEIISSKTDAVVPKSVEEPAETAEVSGPVTDLVEPVAVNGI